MKSTLLLFFSVFMLQTSFAGIQTDTIYAGFDTTIAGIPIHFDYNVSIFPYEWQIAPTSGYGTQIAIDEIPRTKSIMSGTLVKYPQEMLEKNLTAVYFLKSMGFFEVGFGGTNSTDIVYLTNDGAHNGYTNAYIEQTFHHEFSSILIRNYPELINKDAWNAISESGNTDPEGGVGAIRNGTASTSIDTALCAFGFLTQYSLSDFENDVNMLAQSLFEPYYNFWDTVDQYPKLQQKVDLLIEFYHQLDPVFTESYFREM